MKQTISRARARVRSRAAPVTAVLALMAPMAQAIEINTGRSDLVVRWDNSVKYSAATRLNDADAALLSNPNTDDGDRNFSKGLISNRIDYFTELDASWQKRFGGRFSGAAYYDSVYNRANDNPGFQGGAFPNQVSVPFNEFTDATRSVHGRKAEVLDAFVSGKFDLADTTVTVRAGRHALIWGESLFFGSNAIAGGQMPVDAVKLVSVPGTQFKEAIRPVPQVSVQAQLSSTVTVGAYLQTRWSASRLPAVGSYFSSVDAAVDGSESLLLGPGAPPALRDSDARPKNSGQGGLQLRLRGTDTDYGFYAIRYHAKSPQVVTRIGLTPTGPVPVGYYQSYQEGITAFGASANRTFGDFNVGLEASVRHGQDLASSRATDLSAFTPATPTDNDRNPGYALGRTAHVNLSTIATLPMTPLWREASLVGEIAWSRVLSVTKNREALDPNGTRDGAAVRFVLEPTYRGVVPGVDLSVPFGVGWAPKGSRPLASPTPNGWLPDGGGDVSLGVNGSFRDVWRFSFAVTHYFGSSAPLLDPDAANAYTWKQSLRDRDFLSASLRYSF